MRVNLSDKNICSTGILLAVLNFAGFFLGANMFINVFLYKYISLYLC